MSVYDILNHEIYPRVFDMADSIFPEFEFKRKGDRWVSSNKLKVCGGLGNETEKVSINASHPYFIGDWRDARKGKEISIYIQEREGLNSRYEAAKFLSQAVGYQLPNTVSISDKKDQHLPLIRTTLHEALNDLFIETLNNEPRDSQHWEYLKQRKYVGLLSCEDRDSKEYRMEIGVAPSREEQKRYLLKMGFTETEIHENYFYGKKDNSDPFEINKHIGSTHTLTFPFRDVSGRIIGFIARNHNHKIGEKPQKYIVTYGLVRKDKLFNMTTRKNLYEEVILVEGYLDALYAKALGMPNVIALGSAGFNIEQAQLLKKMGVKRITLALDEDEAGRAALDNIIEILTHEIEDLSVCVASLPDSFKDPDELIRAKGISAFRKVIEEATSWDTHKLNVLLKPLQPPLTDKERETVVETIIKIGRQVKTQYQENFIHHFQKIGTALNLSGDTLAKVLKDKARREQEERHNSELSRLNAQLTKATGNKDYEAVKEIHSNIGKHINSNPQKEDQFKELTTIVTKENLIIRLKEKPDALFSGYMIGEEKLLIPTGAISIVAGPTSHGKTTTLLNLALNQALVGKKVHLFSYEENKEAILIKAMNAYIDIHLSNDNKRSLASYLKGEDYIIWSPTVTKEILNAKIEEFFQEVIGKGLLQIHYVNYSSNKLIESIFHLQEKGLVDVVVIDYIQQLNEESSKLGAKRHEEIKTICDRLKNCAVETKLPIIAGAQFNRSVTSLDRMNLSAIGEAGDIERIANLCIGIWNHKFPQLDDKNKVPEDFTPLKAITFKVLKDRDGGLAWKEGTLDWDGNKGTINNFADDHSLNAYSANKEGLSTPFDKPSLNHTKTKGGRKKKYPIHDPYTAKDYKEATDGY